MRGRLVKLGAGLAACAALAVGGATIASGNPKAAPTKPSVTKTKQVTKAKPSVTKTKHATAIRAAALRTAAPASEPAETASESESSAPESAADTAAQDAACKARGIDPNGDNVQYDDVTGTCSAG